MVALLLMLAALLIGFFAARHPGARPAPKEPKAATHLPVRSTDLLVWGSGLPGISAAVAAADEGLHVTLLSADPIVGGTLTLAELNTLDLSYGALGQPTAEGIFGQFWRALGYRASFGVSQAQTILEDMLRRAGVQVHLGCHLRGVSVAAGQVRSVRVACQGHTVSWEAPYYVDASGNADLAYMAGAPFTVGWTTVGLGPKMQAPTLVFGVRGVDWAQTVTAVYGGRRPHTHSVAGFGAEMLGYRDSSPRLHMRGLNLGLEPNGTVLVNALWIYGVNGLSASSRAQGRQLAVKALPGIVRYLRAHIPGFAQATLEGAAKALYVRETRHLRADYVLNAGDELGNRAFSDQIGINAYPMDVQSPDPATPGQVYGRPEQYGIPFRALIPLGYQNLLVVGRSAGFTPVAAGSARVLPAGAEEGQAAGVAAFIAYRHRATFQRLGSSPSLVEQLQHALLAQGAYLYPFHVTNTLTQSWAFPYLGPMVDHMLAVGGYANQFGLNQSISGSSFAALLSRVERFVYWHHLSLARPVLPSGAIDGQQALAAAQSVLGSGASGSLLSGPLAAHFAPQAPLTVGEAYGIIVNLGHAEAMAHPK